MSEVRYELGASPRRASSTGAPPSRQGIFNTRRTAVTIVGDHNRKIVPTADFVVCDRLIDEPGLADATVTRLAVSHRATAPTMAEAPDRHRAVITRRDRRGRGRGHRREARVDRGAP